MQRKEREVGEQRDGRDVRDVVQAAQPHRSLHARKSSPNTVRRALRSRLSDLSAGHSWKRSPGTDSSALSLRSRCASAGSCDSTGCGRLPSAFLRRRRAARGQGGGVGKSLKSGRNSMGARRAYRRGSRWRWHGQAAGARGGRRSRRRRAQEPAQCLPAPE